MVFAAIGLVAPSSASTHSDAARGGTYRVGWEAVFDWGTDDGDPTGESDPRSFGIFSNLLLRTLVGYNHVPGAAGRKLVPDLAVNVPRPTNGGRLYTFSLKRGIRFGPPVNRKITSRDLRYALERLARPRNGAHYAYYYSVIRGFDAYRAGKARSIAGIRTPDAKTIAFELTRPVAEFLHRLTLPATAPIPPEVGRCFEGKPGRYGLDAISSGPYMYEGAGEIAIASCRAIKPMRGHGYPIVTLVRNPRYDPRTDSRKARANNPDRFVFTVVHGRPAAAVVADKLDAGELDDAILTSSPKVPRRYWDVARREGRLRFDGPDWLFYISLNLAQPPFDDVHVRRALAWTLDRAALRDAWGGSATGPPARHLVPDRFLDGRLHALAPFATRGDHGSVARARAEMARSRYATRRGVCVTGACKRVFLSVNCNADRICGDIEYAAGQRMLAPLRAGGAAIGLTFASRLRPTKPDLRLPRSNIAISPSGYWRDLYPDASGFLDAPFSGTSITPTHNPNTALLGITPARAAALGVEGKVAGVPSVDRDLARCAALAGGRRLDCYAALDRKLTAEIVPWIPFLWRRRITILGPQVAHWAYDESTGTTSFAHVALKG